MPTSMHERQRFFAVSYPIQFSDTMAYGSHHFLTNFRFQCHAREKLLFSSSYFATAEAKRELDAITLLTVDGYTRNFAPAMLGEELAVLLSLEALGRTSLRFCFRVLNARGEPVTAGYQTVVAADRASGEPTLWPEGMRAALESLRALEEPAPFSDRVHRGGKDALFSPAVRDLGARLLARQRASAPALLHAPAPLPSGGALVESRGRAEGARVALFGGQGTLSLATFAALAATRDLGPLDAICRDELGVSLRSLLADDGARALAAEPELDQAAIFLTSLWLAESQPEPPDVFVGHSFGEIAALCAAGAFDVEAGLRIVCRRARALKQYAGRGALAVLSASEDEVRRLLERASLADVHVAGVNHAEQTVVAADPDVLEKLAAACAEPVRLSRVASRYAFHTPRLARAAAHFLAALDDVAVSAPARAVYSPIHDEYYDGCSGEEIKARLAAHLVTPFDFLRAIRRLFAEGCRDFVECSGQAALASSLRRTFADKVRVSSAPRPTVAVAPSADGAEGEAYAIVGYGCVLPGAADSEAFWRLLREGQSGIVDMRAVDPSYADFFDATQRGAPKTYSALAGRVDDAAIATSPVADARGYDRTQRLLAAALSQCASSLGREPGRVRCLLGATADGSEALDLAWLARDLEGAGVAGVAEVLDARDPAALSPSRALSAVVGDVLGPEVRTSLLDAACASSLFATALGARLLGEHQADVVVAGGVFSPGPGNSCLFSQFRGLSDKASRPFDREASGVIFGEGAAVVVLKRLADALRDGDRVAAVLRGAGVSSDGRSPSANVPQKAGQVTAMRRAYERSGIAPASVQFVEAHGTATPKGDDTELESMSEVFAGRGSPLLVGSVKAQIGHTGWAAGTASIIKLCLALQRRALPRQHNFAEPSLSLAARRGLLDVVRAEAPWPANGSSPRRAATSGFGFGGTNAHVILEEFVPEYHRRWANAAALPRSDRLALVAIETLAPQDGRRFSKDASRSDCRLPSDVRLLPDLVDSLDRGQLLALRLVHPMAPALQAIRRDVAAVFAVPDKAQLARQVQLHVYRDHLLRVAAREGKDLSPALDRARAGAPAAGPYTLQGMMQNVVSGRVAGVFDWQGPNFTVDGGARGLADALEMAPLLVSTGTKVAVVGALELGEQAPGEREGAMAVALCRPEVAAELGLAPRAFVRFDAQREGAPLDVASLGEAVARAAHGEATRLQGGIVVEGVERKEAGFRRAPIARYTPALLPRRATAALEPPKRVLVLARSGADALASALRAQGSQVHVVAPERLDADLASTIAADAVLCVESVDAEEGPVLHAVDAARALFEAHAAALRVLYPRLGATRVAAVVAGGVAVVGGAARLHPVTGLYSGLLKSLARETGAPLCRAVVFEGASDPEAVLAELRTPGVLEAVYHGGRRHERVLTEARLGAAEQGPSLDATKVVLLTGGARGVTAVCAEALLARYGCRLVLCGRSPVAVEPRWLAYEDDELLERDFYAETRRLHPGESLPALRERFERLRAGIEASRTLARLKKLGDCEYVPCDVASGDDVRWLFDAIAERYGRLDLIVHGAGVQLSKRYDKRSADDIRTTLDVKLRGLMHLVEHARRFGPSVPLHVLTSAFSYFGNDGQADYGAANEALDRACAWLAGPERSCVSVGWLAWNQIGMTRRAEYRLLGATRGLRGVDADEGGALFLELLAARDPIQVLMTEDERRFYGVEVLRGELPVTLDADVDRYVAQHRVGGVPTMPGAFLLDRVLAALLEHDPALARAPWVEVADVRFHRFLKLDRPQALRLRLLGDGRVHVVGDVVHRGGRVLQPDVLFAEAAVRPCAPEAARLLAPERGDTITDRYVEPGAPVALSGAFDCLRDIVLGPHVRGARCASSGDGGVLGRAFSALAVDAAWRLYALSPSRGASHVPLGLARLVVHRALVHAPPERILAAAPRVEKDALVCDRFEVTDAAGQVLLVGEGCVARDLEVKLP